MDALFGISESGMTELGYEFKCQDTSGPPFFALPLILELVGRPYLEFCSENSIRSALWSWSFQARNRPDTQPRATLSYESHFKGQGLATEIWGHQGQVYTLNTSGGSIVPGSTA